MVSTLATSLAQPRCLVAALMLECVACSGADAPGAVRSTGLSSSGGAAGASAIAGAAGSSSAGSPSASGGASAGAGGAFMSGGALTSGGAGGAGPGGSGASAGAAGTAGGAGGGSAQTSGTFYVSGRDLYDRCGTKVVLRGVNEMVVWSSGKDGVPEFSEIAKTGANAVRIVWSDEGTASELDTAIDNAVAQGLIPIVENHDATGDLSKVSGVVDYWTQVDVVAVLENHASHLLLNIANEAGATVSQSAFEATYEDAISRIRDSGVDVPLVIDAPGWGQDINMLQAAGSALQAHDPRHNVLFSVHMWWDDSTGARVKSELQQSVDMGLPLIVGEFAQHAVTLCDDKPFAYKVLLAEAQKHGIGWLAWSWGSVANSDCASEGSFDMTVGGVYGKWEGTWASDVAINDANSIQKTSVRPASMVDGACP